MTVELSYIFTWREKEYVINIVGTSLHDCTAQANALLTDMATLGTVTSPSEGQKGNASFEMEDTAENEDEMA
jgi:hypothetical protein